MTSTPREEIGQMAQGFWVSMPILVAQHMKIFDRLARGPKTPVQLRRSLGADLRALRRLLDALVGLGLIQWHGEKLRLTPKFVPVLDPSSPDCVGPMLEHQRHLLASWVKLEAAVLDGVENVRGLGGTNRDVQSERVFHHAMASIGREGAEELMDGFDFDEVECVLDVGGGTGVIAATICKAIKGMKWQILDCPAALAMAHRRLHDEGVASQVTCHRGDALETEWPLGSDTILLSHLIHSCSEAQTRELIKRAARTLPKGGQLLIRDFVPRDPKRPNPHTGVFGINMLLATESGRIYNLPELKRMIAPAFKFQRLIDIGRTQLLIAKRR